MIAISNDTDTIYFCILSIDDSSKFVASKFFTCSVTNGYSENRIMQNEEQMI